MTARCWQKHGRNGIKELMNHKMIVNLKHPADEKDDISIDM